MLKKNDRAILPQFGVPRVRKTGYRENFLVKTRVFPQKSTFKGHHGLLLSAQTVNAQVHDGAFLQELRRFHAQPDAGRRAGGDDVTGFGRVVLIIEANGNELADTGDRAARRGCPGTNGRLKGSIRRNLANAASGKPGVS